jgi:hypothetical protein
MGTVVMVAAIAASSLSVSAQTDEQANPAGQSASCGPWEKYWETSEGWWYFWWYRSCYDPQGGWYTEWDGWEWAYPIDSCPEPDICIIAGRGGNGGVAGPGGDASGGEGGSATVKL